MTSRIQMLLEKIPTGLHINGEWVNGSTSETFDVENPATGETIATLASGTSEDAIAALDAASAIQNEWARIAPRDRAEILRKAFELVTDRADDFAMLMTLEMGKPLKEAYGEVQYGAEYLRWFSEEAVRLYGRSMQSPEGNLRMTTVRKPVGPCLLITPWNFPLAMATRKVAPAIAAGCTMIIKPAKLTPLTTQLFVSTLTEAGVPAGVVNVVSGRSASAISSPLIRDPRLRKVSFTGSTPVGVSLLKECADNVLRTSMELGGNAPFIVFDDVDVNAAVEGAVAAKLRNNGEACTAANRFIVHESVAEEFSAKLASHFDSLTLGAGLESGTDVGPLVEDKAVANIERLVNDAIAGGATVLSGGARINGPGHFYQPTVLTGVPHNAAVITEEIFGPVAPVITFSSENEAWHLANSTPYGLASYVYTRDSGRMYRASDQLEFGLLGINTGVISNAAAPFGGVKHSGLGREGGAEGIDEYTTVQYVGMADPYSG